MWEIHEDRQLHGRVQGYPAAARTDNGPEFTCRAFMTWTQKRSIQRILIEPSSHAERLHRELSRHVSGLVEGWELVWVFGANPPSHCHMESRLRRDKAAQHMWALVTCNVRRIESPVIGASMQHSKTDLRISKSCEPWTFGLDWYGHWVQAVFAKTCRSCHTQWNKWIDSHRWAVYVNYWR